MRKILILMLLMALLCGCTPAAEPPAKEPSEPTRQESTTPSTPTMAEDVTTGQTYAEAQLLGEAETREEAEELAELYGITLVDYKNGLGRFHTEEDPRDVIRRGKENGWPELVLNRVTSLD